MGLEASDHISKIMFRNCGLTDENLKTILAKVNIRSLRELDISYNHLLT